MKFHVVNLPHTELTKDYLACAYTQKCVKLVDMMWARGHEVFKYTSTRTQRKKWGFNGPEDYLKIDFNDPVLWPEYNKRIIKQIKANIKPGDFICLITPSHAIKDAFPGNIIVEFGVGYKGVMNPGFRVFESYAWRNFVYGKFDLEGQFFDEVIPNYFEVEDFPFRENKKDQYLFIGRLNANKGLGIAQEVCEKLGKKLIVAGPGEFSGYGEYVGVVGSEERGRLMSQSKAVFVPTIYIPPFEGVHIEANLCGTPVITTDFGVFSETVINGFNGQRCKMFKDFLAAMELEWDYKAIREDAISKYSLEVVGEQYENYFKRLLTLTGAGWYAK